MVTYSKMVTSTIASAAADQSVGTYDVPAGMGGTLKAVVVGYVGTVETGVSQSGKITLTNSAKHWEPFELELPVMEALVTTEGGGAVMSKNIAYQVNKDLPAGSKVTIKADMNDDGSSIVHVLLMWESP